MLIDDFMYQGDLIGELNKDASVIMFTLSKMLAPRFTQLLGCSVQVSHSLWDAPNPLFTQLINPSVQSGSCTALVFTGSDSLQYKSFCRLGLCSLVHISASCFKVVLADYVKTTSTCTSQQLCHYSQLYHS